MPIWTEQGQMFTNWEGPDGQDGLGYVRRWTDGQHAVVDVAFYVMPSPTGGYEVWRETERTLCRDITEPGGTEVWADATPACIVRGLHNAVIAHTRAAAAARTFSGTSIDWDGRTSR
jgi:hypothetical protein